MFELFLDLEYIRADIDDLLVMSTSTFEEYLGKLEKAFACVSDAGLKINANKLQFVQSLIEYLGHWITQEGIQPLPKVVTATPNFALPTNRKQLHHFIGMVNYYCDMWKRRSEVLAPLSHLTSNIVPFQWSDIEQTAFDKAKSIIW